MTYLRKNYGTRQTPQSEKIPGSTQEKNNAGGLAWKVDNWKQLDRFLILGSEGGTYYVGERKLTKDNVKAVIQCVKEDGFRTVNRIVEISEAGRAPKNDPALFALAVCASLGDARIRQLALEVLPQVARIGTHLFHFADYVQQFRGWGRGLRTAVANWYISKTPDDLAFQAVKYQGRDGWTHGDLIRLSHPQDGKKGNLTKNAIYQYILKDTISPELPQIIQGFERIMKAVNEKEVVLCIGQYGLTQEMVPTQYLKSPKVWEALLPNLGLTAVIRNLGNMSKSGFLAQGNWNAVNAVTNRINDTLALKKSRVHPITVLAALLTYSQGHGTRGKGEWDVVPDIVDALDTSFYLAFGNVLPTGKRIVLALDVSGSMSSGEVAGIPGLTPRLASAALSMVTFKTEKQVALISFQDKIIPLDISRCSRLKEVEKVISNLEFGRTDCAQPILWATKQDIKADAFVIYTDSETWYGDIHPAQALNNYRRDFGLPSKLVVVGMVANEVSIADPNDSGMLDVVGFDTATPEVISQFIKE